MKTIRQLREERGWTQLHLAVRLGVTPVTIYNWEQGRSQPRVAQFRQLARLFDVSMDDVALVGEGGQEAGPVSAPPAAGSASDDR